MTAKEKDFDPRLYIHLDGEETSPTKRDLLESIRDYYDTLLGIQDFLRETSTPEERKEIDLQIERLQEIRDSWEEADRDYRSPETPDERRKEIAISVAEWIGNFILLRGYREEKKREREKILEAGGKVPEITEEDFPPYRIEVDPETLKARKVKDKIHLWGNKYLIPGEAIIDLPPIGSRDPLEDLEHIRESAKSGLVKVSSDLWKSGTGLFRDSLGISIISDKTRETIKRKEAEGKLLAGTLMGLKGGGRYFKVFNIALAQTLYEQSKYYNTQDNLSGVPRDLISQYAGEGAIVEKIKDPSTKFKGGERPYPIVLLSWEDIAKKMSPDGKISGGKDIKVVRDFVQGYSQKMTDPKTGKVKTAYIPGLLGREYLVEGERSLIGVPYMSKIFSLYPKDSPDKEVGIAVQLSPLFAQTLKFGYTGIRSDTIQKLGGGKLKEITINLFYYLAYNRGIPPQKGRNKGEFPRRKRDLLEELSEGIKSYKDRPKRREADFQEAVRKCIDAKILLPGKTRTGGLRGYREEINPGGQTISIFTYNPDYLKGEEITLFSELDDQ